MQINQFVPSVHYDDAVGSTALIMDRIFREMGFSGSIYALYRDPSLLDSVSLFRKDAAPRVENDINILHFALPSPLTEFFLTCGGTRILVFHNITPPHFFSGFQEELVTFTALGLEEIASLVAPDIRTVAYSAFSARDLALTGFRRTEIMPFLINWERYQVPEMPVLNAMLGDGGWKNVLFVGRLVPNKRQDDLIRLITLYQKRFHEKVRLVLVGKGREGERYSYEMRRLIAELGDPPVFFTGRVTPAELVTCWRNSQVFASMSEHEGFCVPLIEAMFFDVPIIAHASSAIPDTLSDAGIIVEGKDFEVYVEIMHQILHDDRFRADILERQRARLAHFLPDQAIPKWRAFLTSCIENR